MTRSFSFITPIYVLAVARTLYPHRYIRGPCQSLGRQVESPVNQLVHYSLCPLSPFPFPLLSIPVNYTETCRRTCKWILCLTRNTLRATQSPFFTLRNTRR